MLIYRIFAPAMNRRKLLLSLLALTLVSISASAQYIQVNDTYTAQQLVENVLLNNSCASVSNISVSGGNFAGGEQSYGYFNAAGTIFPMQNGIILSTGRAVKAVGPNTSLLDDGNNMNWGGDNDLQRALGINNSTNATVLEFNFVPLTNKISFTYLMASEEYHDDAPCRYSDGFAFLLKEADNPTAPYSNLAIIPGTNTAVKVTSVHPCIGDCGVNNGCPAANEQYFDAFNGTEYPTNFNGQTKVMTATSAVSPGLRYHIKLVIADETNYRYDSAIFLGGSSFEADIDLGTDRLFATNSPLCYNEPYLLNGTSAGATAYQWYNGTTAITGATSPTYTARTPGTYKVVATFSPTCSAEGQITLEYTAPLSFGSHTLLQCDDDNDARTLYNLQLANDLITNGNTQLVVNGYYETQSNAETDTAAITNATAYPNTSSPQTVYARVQNQYGCTGVAAISLDISSNTLTPPAPLELCDTDGPVDGNTAFDLTTKNAEILQSLPANVQLSYYESEQAAATANMAAIATPQAYTNTVAYNQMVYARLTQGTDCYGIVPLQLTVYPFGSDLRAVSAGICNNVPVVLDAGATAVQYEWNTIPVQTTQQISVAQAGTYTVTLTNAYNCTATKTFTVTASERATITGIDINDFNGGSNSITVNTTGIGSYEYSLNLSDWQESNVFNNLESGLYTVYVRDTNQCGIVIQQVFVLDYPKYFTPNGDNINDYWNVPYLSKRPGVAITIYDRYGKYIYTFHGSTATKGWDGTLNNHPLPATDYWFTITLENGTVVRGHFSLIR